MHPTEYPRAIPLTRWSWLAFPPEMTPAERGVLRAIITGPRPWTKRADLDASYPGAVAGLIKTGWVEAWDFPRYEVARLGKLEAVERGIPVKSDPGEPTSEVVTLTEWGAGRLGLTLKEHWVYRTAAHKTHQGAGKPRKKTRVRLAEAVPRWTAAEVTDKGDPVPPDPPKPLPTCVAETGLPIPVIAIETKRANRDVLVDPVNGKPVTLWGRTVVVDERLGKG